MTARQLYEALDETPENATVLIEGPIVHNPGDIGRVMSLQVKDGNVYLYCVESPKDD